MLKYKLSLIVVFEVLTIPRIIGSSFVRHSDWRPIQCPAQKKHPKRNLQLQWLVIQLSMYNIYIVAVVSFNSQQQPLGLQDDSRSFCRPNAELISLIIPYVWTSLNIHLHKCFGHIVSMVKLGHSKNEIITTYHYYTNEHNLQSPGT